MPPLSLEELKRLVDIMKQMHNEAVCANWRELARLDSERRAVLKYDPTIVPSTTQNPLGVKTVNTVRQGNILNLPNTNSQQLSDLTEEIFSLDKLIIDTVQNAREELLGKNRELSNQLKAQKLYAITSSMS